MMASCSEAINNIGKLLQTTNIPQTSWLHANQLCGVCNTHMVAHSVDSVLFRHATQGMPRAVEQSLMAHCFKLR